MSITSSYDFDHSSSLAKQFAGLAASYMDNPDEARNPVARVPLENLFRILEMYRYDDFKDEDRSGVLALKGFESSPPIALRATQAPWHEEILAALENARDEVFPTETKDDAVQRLEDGLRQLSRDGYISGPLADLIKRFWVTFAASI